MALAVMNAIRSMFVALTSIQAKGGNPYPQISVSIALVGQIFIPVLAVLQKYIYWLPSVQILFLSISSSFLIVWLAVRSAAGFRMIFEGGMSLRMKVFAALIFPALVFVFVARASPEGALLLYAFYSILPLGKILGFPIEKRDPENR